MSKCTKEYENTIKEHMEELSLCRAEVKKTVDSNVKLSEENKTLHALIEANEDIEEELENQNCGDDADLENDEVFADSILTVNGIKYKRTSPLTEAEKAKEPETGARAKEYACNKCEQIFKTMGLLKRHENTQHIPGSIPQPGKENRMSKAQKSSRMKCNKCDFVCESKANLTNHVQNSHVLRKNSSIPCKFWQNGYCRYSEEMCRFSHSMNENMNKICYFGIYCKKPDCVFVHQKPCNFQQNCRNSNCNFFHFQNEPFLDMNSRTEFPPLQAKSSFKPWMMWF